MPLHSLTGLRSGARVLPATQHPRLAIGPEWLGRVVNGVGIPIDEKGPVTGGDASAPIAATRSATTSSNLSAA